MRSTGRGKVAGWIMISDSLAGARSCCMEPVCQDGGGSGPGCRAQGTCSASYWLSVHKSCSQLSSSNLEPH